MHNAKTVSISPFYVEPFNTDLFFWAFAAIAFALIVILLFGGDDQPPYW